jgi:hypothetical protein
VTHDIDGEGGPETSRAAAVDLIVEPRWITTADGVTLEAEVVVPQLPVAAVLLTHPHPLYGGSMRSLVTSELFRALPTHDFAVVRFNFRGVERSGGEHGGGWAERLDVEAGLDAIESVAPNAPIVVAGWSFGADVALTVVDKRIRGWFLIAPPLRVLPAEAFVAALDPRPKHVAVPERDEFNPPSSARERTRGWKSTEIEVVPGADHFLVGRTESVTASLVAFIGSLRDPASS